MKMMSGSIIYYASSTPSMDLVVKFTHAENGPNEFLDHERVLSNLGSTFTGLARLDKNCKYNEEASKNHDQMKP